MAVEALREIYGATPAIPGDNASTGWRPEKYRRMAGKAADGGREWIYTNGSIFFTRTSVHPATVGFLGTLTDLASVDRMGALSIQMSRMGADEDAEADDPVLLDTVTFA